MSKKPSKQTQQKQTRAIEPEDDGGGLTRAIEENTARIMSEDTRDPHSRGIEHQTEGRAPRVSMSAGGKLNVPDSLKEEGYMYYWAVDRPGMLAQFEAAWWEFVNDPRTDKQMTTPAGNGETHYLMRIPQKYYDEDMRKQQDRVNDGLIEAAKVESGQYIPKDREGVLEREVIA